MSAAVSLAVETSAENNFILNHTFNLFSLISFEPLPVDIIVKYIQELDQNCDKEEITLALKDCSLFLLNETEDCDVWLHRVVHEAIKLFSDCKETENKDYHPSGIASKRTKVDFASRFKNVVQHVVRAFHFKGRDDKIKKVEVARRAQNVLKALFRFAYRDNKIKIIPHLKEFNTAVEKLLPEQDSLYSLSLAFEKLDIYEIYLFFGKTLNAYCEYKLALKFHETNLEIWRDSENHIYRARIFNELGLSYARMGHFDQAKDYYQRALEIEEKQLGPDHVDLAKFYNNIGGVYCTKGDLNQAKDYYQRALEIKDKQLGPNHVDVAVNYNNIGSVYYKKGDLDQAKDYYQRALEIRATQLCPNYVDVAVSYNNIGLVYSDKGDLDQAKDYYQRALEIQEKQLGPNHVDVAFSYNNIGGVYFKKGDLDQAKDYYQRALEIEEKQL
ncbi:nephrocystin-3-like, partial, partial [Paramuricea clavata]